MSSHQYNQNNKDKENIDICTILCGLSLGAALVFGGLKLLYGCDCKN